MKTLFSTFLSWLNTTEMFARPSKKVPGKWKLIEYYYEPEQELMHILEEQLKADGLKWEIGFEEDKKYFQNSTLAVPLLTGIEDGIWSISKNFITLINPADFRKNVEFQFFIEKGILKLLRKDAFGKIEFFGFFRKQNSV